MKFYDLLPPQKRNKYYESQQNSTFTFIARLSKIWYLTHSMAKFAIV